MPKKNEGAVWDFSTSILSQSSEKIEREPFKEKNFREKKSRNAEKLKGRTLWSPPVLYVTRETFLVQFLGPTGTIWRLKILYNFWRNYCGHFRSIEKTF